MGEHALIEAAILLLVGNSVVDFNSALAPPNVEESAFDQTILPCRNHHDAIANEGDASSHDKEPASSWGNLASDSKRRQEAKGHCERLPSTTGLFTRNSGMDGKIYIHQRLFWTALKDPSSDNCRDLMQETASVRPAVPRWAKEKKTNTYIHGDGPGQS